MDLADVEGQPIHDPPGATSEVDRELVESVRDALVHLYDLTRLQTHPLLAWAPLPDGQSVARGKFLRRELLDSIEELRPALGVAAPPRDWRLYRILELRYVEAAEVSAALEKVGLSKSQYHREHYRALVEVAMVLWERWESRRGSAAIPRHPGSPAGAGDLARTEAEHLSRGVSVSHLDVGDVIHEVADLLRPLYDRHGVLLRLTLADSVPPLRGDRVALRQALLAILGRAIHGIDHSAVEVALSTGPGQILIDVAGSGRDLIETDQVGLGEARAFIEALNGQLTFRSSPLPTFRWSVRVGFPMNDRPRLLVVDNNPDFLQLITRYLTDHNWDVVGATDVDQAYRLAHSQSYRAVLLDVVIPGRDGWDLLVQLRTSPATRALPVVICSVLDEPELAIAQGVAAYLQKPVSQSRLLAALEPFR